MIRWIDLFAGIAIIALLIMLFYRRKISQPLPDIIRHIKGQNIELVPTYSSLLGNASYDSKCPTCEDNKLEHGKSNDNNHIGKVIVSNKDSETVFKSVLILPFYPFDVIEVPDFLTPIECDMMKSDTTNTLDYASVQNKIYPLINEYLNIPPDYYEPLTLSYMNINDRFPASYDSDTEGRMISFYVFLNDGYTGGELEFPLIMKKIKPKKGKAVFWRNIDPKQEVIIDSIHVENPVLSGVKWIGKIYVHAKH